MKLNLSKIVVRLIIIMLVLIAVLDVLLPEDHPNRFIAVYLQGLVLGVSFLYLFKTYISKIETTTFHQVLLVFIAMLVIYGIFTPNLTVLPVLLYGLVFFYLSYYLTYKGFIQLKHIQILAIALFVIYSYETYLSVFERAEHLGDFFRSADNVGYKSLMLMLLFALDLKNVRNIIFLSLTFVLVLISFKRGAMVAGTLAYAISMWPILTGKFKIKKRTKLYLTIVGLTVLALIVYLMIAYWEIIIFRFVTDETGGSGRDLFWSEIVKGWKNADLINQIFGFGLFTVPEYLETSLYGGAIYAHSDWYELLYDHGVLGIMLYSILITSIISISKKVYKYAQDLYYPFLMAIVIWLPKSYFSGVYINKGTIYLMLVLGFILAQTIKKSHQLRQNNG